MRKPFNIFPRKGYLNSHFQIVTSENNIEIDIYNGDDLILTVAATSEDITQFNISVPGNMVARCNVDGRVYEQEFEVLDALMLGDSEFKDAFVFENCDYSFFLMKDRIVLYNDQTGDKFIEYGCSPTEIIQLDKIHFLFITRIGELRKNIVNIGIYNLETFSIIGELLDNYQEVSILPESNLVWLKEKNSKDIICFELLGDEDLYLREQRCFKDYIRYIGDIDDKIYVFYDDFVEVCSLHNPSDSVIVDLDDNVAIDKYGYVYLREEQKLIYRKLLNENDGEILFKSHLNFDYVSMLYCGKNLYSVDADDKFWTAVEERESEIKQKLPDKLPAWRKKVSFSFDLKEQTRVIERFHTFYPTDDGIFDLVTIKTNILFGYDCKKELDEWVVKPSLSKDWNYRLNFISDSDRSGLINICSSLLVKAYIDNLLHLVSNDEQYIIVGNNKLKLSKEKVVSFLEVDEKLYVLIDDGDKFTLYLSSNLKRTLLLKVNILNYDYIDKHRKIWYSKNKNLGIFDLETGSEIDIEKNTKQQINPFDIEDLKFYEDYALGHNDIVFNPATLEVKDSYVGLINSYSSGLNKIVFHRKGIVYLSIFNKNTHKFDLQEIPLVNSSYKESFLSPGGNLLALKDNSDKCYIYDIAKDETIEFKLGIFLAFTNDGNLVVETGKNRLAKLFDPVTFQEVKMPNYYHYQFISPDRKLYAQIWSKERYINRLNGCEISFKEYNDLKKDLDEPRKVDDKTEQQRVVNNRNRIFNQNRELFIEFNIMSSENITSDIVVKKVKYTVIGIVGTDITAEIELDSDLDYYNYAAFSYDNRYFSYVGKPSSGGLIHIFRIDFNEKNKTLKVLDSFKSTQPRYASWVCAFSKTGYFATYDSTPDTYIFEVDNSLFDDKKVNRKIFKSHSFYSDVVHNSSREGGIIVRGLNFICFSPSGKYVAFSEQGYWPFSKGGHGHMPSNAIHIGLTEHERILKSFHGQGETVKEDKNKKVVFAGFSEDERKIMSLSADGVVTVRNIDLSIQ